MIPAHFLFMHLARRWPRTPPGWRCALQNPWIKLIDAALVLSAIYHGGYGLNSILNDYVGSKELRVVGSGTIYLRNDDRGCGRPEIDRIHLKQTIPSGNAGNGLFNLFKNCWRCQMGNKAFELASKIKCDVLIVGAGGAGLRCAAHILEKRPGTNILAVTKVSHPQNPTPARPRDDWRRSIPRTNRQAELSHVDTWKGSDCMADQDVSAKSSMRPGRNRLAGKQRHALHSGRGRA